MEAGSSSSSGNSRRYSAVTITSAVVVSVILLSLSLCLCAYTGILLINPSMNNGVEVIGYRHSSPTVGEEGIVNNVFTAEEIQEQDNRRKLFHDPLPRTLIQDRDSCRKLLYGPPQTRTGADPDTVDNHWEDCRKLLYNHETIMNRWDIGNTTLKQVVEVIGYRHSAPMVGEGIVNVTAEMIQERDNCRKMLYDPLPRTAADLETIMKRWNGNTTFNECDVLFRRLNYLPFDYKSLTGDAALLANLLYRPGNYVLRDGVIHIPVTRNDIYCELAPEDTYSCFYVNDLYRIRGAFNYLFDEMDRRNRSQIHTR